MGKTFTKIPTDAFEKLTMNAGMVVKGFDPTAITYTSQIGATTGGLTVNCTPTFTDFGEDMDNCPNNMKELKQITQYACSIAGTLLTVDKAVGKMLVGAADEDAPSGAIVPRMNLTAEDFQDIWFVGDYSDKNEGNKAGFIAIHLLNALNTSGFSLKTTKDGKGQYAFTLEGHYSMDAQDTVPFELYIQAGTP